MWWKRRNDYLHKRMQQSSAKRIWDYTPLSGEGDPLGTVQDIKLWPFNQICSKPESVLKNDAHKLLRVFEMQTDHLLPARRPDLVLIKNHLLCFIYFTVCQSVCLSLYIYIYIYIYKTDFFDTVA